MFAGLIALLTAKRKGVHRVKWWTSLRTYRASSVSRARISQFGDSLDYVHCGVYPNGLGFFYDRPRLRHSKTREHIVNERKLTLYISAGEDMPNFVISARERSSTRNILAAL